MLAWAGNTQPGELVTVLWVVFLWLPGMEVVLPKSKFLFR